MLAGDSGSAGFRASLGSLMPKVEATIAAVCGPGLRDTSCCCHPLTAVPYLRPQAALDPPEPEPEVDGADALD